MKLRIGLVATVALVAAFALGPTSSPSATGDNAVVHWSDVAEKAISAPTPPATALRPPASTPSSRGWCTPRSTTRSRRSRGA